MEESMAQDPVYTLAASPGYARNGICFAGRASGLYRSDDGGVTWRALFGGLNLTGPLAAMAVTVSPGFEADRCVFVGVQGGILRSSDGGESWHPSVLPSPPPLVTALAISPGFVEDGVLFAGTMGDGIFRSADRGSHWAAWNFGLLDLNVLALATSTDYPHDETLFAGTESGISRSTNGGRAWRELDFPVDHAPVVCLGIAPGYARGGWLLAGTEASGLFGSGDGGKIWSRLGEEAIPSAVNGLVLGSNRSGRQEILALLPERLVLSRDGGRTWSEVKPGPQEGQDVTCVLAPEGTAAGAPLLAGLANGQVIFLAA